MPARRYVGGGARRPPGQTLEKEDCLKFAKVVLVLTVAALAIPVGLATANPPFSMANGGGQFEVPDEGGAGDTIAFTVRDEANPKGQVQYVDRTGGTGQGQIVRHGQPTCFTVEGDTAEFTVRWNDGSESSVFVQDGGPNNDMIAVAPDTSPECGDDEPDELTNLSRGNVTVWDNQ